ncbi:c-type heme family protein [Novipirellula artificiosorum]|uniref:Tll0287-like domain-containing protein n=1 Tax=Novipirellula artificiosorum TaxID=2528016 RepID=A0A5C6E1U3_9BACT|nr:DUF3365 domain-containing protein [Novipirellula artificiosorum]TWU41967.1 hypothetical protein Poly41_02630 [Novipirellula artificiosorum]
MCDSRRTVVGLFLAFAVLAAKADQPNSIPHPSLAATPSEAKVRARLLFETINGSLQVMHRDFFDDEDTFAIPSRSLEDVFSELKKSHHVEIRWMTVNADVLNVDHDAKSEFEKAAVKALSKGEPAFEKTGDGIYQYAGAIPLRSECLKCHLRRRTRNEPRTSALTITIPINE